MNLVNMMNADDVGDDVTDDDEEESVRSDSIKTPEVLHMSGDQVRDICMNIQFFSTNISLKTNA